MHIFNSADIMHKIAKLDKTTELDKTNKKTDKKSNKKTNKKINKMDKANKTGKAKKVLVELEKTLDKYWNLSPDAAKFLQTLAEISKSKKILEVGTSNGYSAIHLALAVQKNKGKVTTIDADFKRANMALSNFKKAGVSKFIELKFGEATELTKSIGGKFDFIFIDANKRQYITYVKNLEKNMIKGTIIVADNAISHKDSMPDYISYMQTSKKYNTSLVPIGSGFLISIRV